MNTSEILTLQFGHYSNYIGTHWWNIQEACFDYNPNSVSEINHDVLFREGVSPEGQVTFTPRLLLVDLKGSLKSLPEEGDLYEPPLDPEKVDVLWDKDSVTTQKKPKASRNHFQTHLDNPNQGSSSLDNSYKLENDIEVWSDFLYTRFHPRTVNVIKDYQYKNTDTPFDVFPVGTALWKTEQFEGDFCDKIRNYIEECDNLQGFHVLLDSVNAFSGLSTSCIEYLRDDYGSKSILAFPVIPSFYEDHSYSTDEQRHQSIINDSIRVLNTLLSFDALAEQDTLYVPLCTGSNGWRQPGPKREFYHTIYDHKSPYHTAAILASGLDTFTLKHRLKSEHYSLVDLRADLSSHGRKAACASVTLPFSLNADADLIDCLDNWEGPLSQCITPNCTIGSDYLMQNITLRGVSENRLKKAPHLAGKQKGMEAYKCGTIKEMMSLYLTCNNYASASNVTIVDKALPVKMPYPSIFDPFVGVNGNVCATQRPNNVAVESVPVLAGLHTGSGVGNMLESLHTEAKKIRFKKFDQFLTGGLEADEFSECLDRLFDLRECYEDSYVI